MDAFLLSSGVIFLAELGDRGLGLAGFETLRD